MFRISALWKAPPGVRVPHNKDTAQKATVKLPIPELIILTMSQHVGAPCTPVVKKGDQVYVGTLVGKAPSPMSMNIYSSVSGTVKSVEDLMYKAGNPEKAVLITPDGNQTPDPSIQPPEVTDKESFLNALKNSGIVGLGGAGFPTAVKVSPNNLSEIDTLLINGAECEPYLTTDNREMLECSDTIVEGIEACLKYLGIPRCQMCIEDNKPEAIAKMREATAGNPKIKVTVLDSRYPQGAEKTLIKNATGREVPRGGLPANVDVIVLNVTTTSSIGKFLRTGMPLVSKRLTVSGDAVENHQNVEVPIGTQIQDVLNFCGLKEEPTKILVGGPMMGNAQMDVNYPITRQNNGLLAFTDKYCKELEPGPCIHCGRCVNACPAGLSPVNILDAYEKYDAERLDTLMADLCIGCGTCSYVCPASRPLTQTTNLAKAFLNTEKRRKKS